jgi:hypothetical protein
MKNSSIPSYIITTGWWSTKDDNDNRKIKVGDSFIRSKEFHNKLWYKAVNRFTNPLKVYIIDSNSPEKPILNKKNEVLIELLENAGHSTNHSGKLCGVSRAHLLGMSIAMANEVDYWVYIEQDALIFGDNIIEECIKRMKKDYMFGYGLGTPQPVQQSLMIMKTDAIPRFIQRFNAIKAKDSEISPEVKFAIASSPMLKKIPEIFYKNMEKNSFLKRVMWKVIKHFKGFDYIPFGYGRVRPIDFKDQYFYFQHASEDEIKRYAKVLMDE